MTLNSEMPSARATPAPKRTSMARCRMKPATATDQTMNITGNITGNLSGSVGSVTGAVGSVTGNVGGNVAGSVASVTGAVGSVTGLTASDVAAIKAVTDKVDTTLVLDGAVYDFTAAALAAAPSGGLDAAGVRSAVGLAAANLDTQLSTIDTVVDAVKVKTDSLTFTKAGEVDANVQSVNDVTIVGDGSATPFNV